MNINVYLFIILYAFRLPKRGSENELPQKRNTLKVKKIIIMIVNIRYVRHRY